jgi:hypothetical protein
VRRFSGKTIAIIALLFAVSLLFGCGEEKQTNSNTAADATQTGTTAATTATKPAEPAGIQLDANLQSATGIQRTMPELTAPAESPYPVVLTALPSSRLEKELIGYGAKNAKDPVGYYSFRYSTFNANRFYLNQSVPQRLVRLLRDRGGIECATYRSTGIRPRISAPGDPVTGSVGEAETFVVVRKDVYNDPVTDPGLFYSVQFGTDELGRDPVCASA